VEPEYRLDIHALPHGLLFEAGPASGTWAGALLGVLDEEGGARVIAQATGPRGEPPQRAVLEYPVKDLRLTAGEQPYTAWALRNRIEAGASSYYALVQGAPGALVFGPFPEGDAELYTLRLT
jgi:hypothetical protein